MEKHKSINDKLVFALLFVTFIIFNSVVLWCRWSQSSNSLLSQVKDITIGQVQMNMILVKGGDFLLGELDTNTKWAKKEAPCHTVTLSDYYIGECEVTQALWREIMGNNPSAQTNDNAPVTNVSWNDIQVFIKALNERSKLNFRLPTDAEWVYAARGGINKETFQYAGSDDVNAVAWNKENADKCHPVKEKQPNALGIYDMSGNAMEWCQNWYGKYKSESQINPTGPEDGKYKVGHGGSWKGNKQYCYPSVRAYDSPSAKYNYLGFRLVLSCESTDF